MLLIYVFLTHVGKGQIELRILQIKNNHTGFIDIFLILTKFLHLNFNFASLQHDVVVLNQTWLDPYLCSSKTC